MKNAIDRGNVNTDGTIWCHGQIVQATSENTRIVIEDAENAIDFHTERIAVINEHPDGVTEEILRELFGVDHRYHGWSNERLIEMLKNRIEASMQYVVDIREAAQNFPALKAEGTVWQVVDLEADKVFFTTSDSQAERWNNDEQFEVTPSPSRRPVAGYTTWMLDSFTDKHSLKLGGVQSDSPCGECGKSWSGDKKMEDQIYEFQRQG